jgi:3-oxoacyl-[acyl-carrier-protein] synthase III
MNPSLTSPQPYTRITGTGSFLPPERLTNAQLVAQLASNGVETSDDWIVSRTGIKARHFASPGALCSDLAEQAAIRALQAAQLDAKEIDLIIVATSTPDMIFPSTACIVQNKLGAHGGAAFDLQAVCSGFVYALTVADAMIRAGAAQKALVIGAELFSKLLDFNDRSTCVLFGDGAGAVVLQASDTPGLLASQLCADGQYADILCTPGSVAGGRLHGEAFLTMNGQAVFKLAVGVLDEVARCVLHKAGKAPADIDWLIAHQASLRIMQSLAKKLNVPEEKLIVTLDQHGNTSAASIPLALDSAVRAGSVQRGDTVLLEGVGGGFTWGAVLLDF